MIIDCITSSVLPQQSTGLFSVPAERDRKSTNETKHSIKWWRDDLGTLANGVEFGDPALMHRTVKCRSSKQGRAISSRQLILASERFLLNNRPIDSTSGQ